MSERQAFSSLLVHLLYQPPPHSSVYNPFIFKSYVPFLPPSLPHFSLCFFPTPPLLPFSICLLFSCDVIGRAGSERTVPWERYSRGSASRSQAAKPCHLQPWHATDIVRFLTNDRRARTREEKNPQTNPPVHLPSSPSRDISLLPRAHCTQRVSSLQSTRHVLCVY